MAIYSRSYHNLLQNASPVELINNKLAFAPLKAYTKINISSTHISWASSCAPTSSTTPISPWSRNPIVGEYTDKDL